MYTTAGFLKKVLVGWALAVGMSSAMASTFYLTDSNILPDGTKYAQVDVLEKQGNLNFTVTPLAPTNWQLADFYFNLAGNPGTVSLSGFPGTWKQQTDQNVSTFGVFSDGEKGNGGSLQSSLSFTVDAVANLTLASLVPNASGWMFAAHMQCQGTSCGPVLGQTSQFVAGPSPVPLPAAVWLFGSALVGFVTVSNRRRI
jgi:hypothetical protein